MKRHKYGAKKTEVNGIKFDSKKEAKRYVELKILEKAGKISDLKLQVRYELVPAIYFFDNNLILWNVERKLKNAKCVQKQTSYIADFVYVENGVEVVEDVKGFKTAAYKKKKRQMKIIYGIDVKEV